MQKFRTHYDNLKVARNAPDAVIRAAYKALMQKYHPDKFEGGAEEALRISKIIKQSFDVLNDSVKRAEHDRWIDDQEAEAKQQNAKAQFAETGQATEQQFYQRKERAEPPKIKEPPAPKPQQTKPATVPEAPKQPTYVWRRICARLLDYAISSVILFLLLFVFKEKPFAKSILSLIYDPSNTPAMQKAFLGIFSAFLWIFIEGALLRLYGTTPGKVMLNLRVSSEESEPRFYSRSFYFWLVGIGCSLPIISLFVALNALRDLKNNRLSYWDRWTKCRIESESISAGRASFAGLFVLALIVGSAIVNQSENGSLTPKKINAHTTLDNSQKQLKLAEFFYNQKHYLDAAEIYRALAEQGNVIAEVIFGMMYEGGQGVSQDYSQAVYWYSKAAEQGDATAQFNLGVMYYKGQGIAQNFPKAVQWYTKAAEQGDEGAQVNLGVMYSQGLGVAQNYSQALYWYTKAAEQGNTVAQSNLGSKYYIGQDVPKNNILAHMWWNIASINDDESRKRRDYVAQEMTAYELQQAQSLANEWLKNHSR